MIATEALAPPRNGLLARLRQAFEALVELDFTQPLAFATLAAAFVVSRVPWVDHGYGTDPDAWRVALTATYMHERGFTSYFPSRLPGYPLHEFVTWVTIPHGWVWCNLSTVAISLVGVLIFAQLVRKLSLPSRGALVLAFAFAPLLWINSTTTMDYMWALTFLMGAYLALLYGAPTAAGASLGLAAGFRLTSLLMLPVFWLLIRRTRQQNQIRPLTMTALAITLGAYTPVLMNYGLNFFNFFDQKIPLGEFIRHLAKDGLGVIGALAVVVAILFSLPRLRSLPRDVLHDPQVITWVAAMGIFFASYMRLPHEIAYLIPLFPFGFFLMARYMSRGVLVACLAAIVFAGFIDVTTHGEGTGIHVSTFTHARIGQGMLLSDIDTMRNQTAFANEVRQLTLTNRDIHRPAVVAIGFIYPELVMLHKKELTIGTVERDLSAISQLSDKGLATDRQHNIEYVWLLDYNTFQEFTNQGKTIYVTPDAERSMYTVYGYRPAYFGAIELPLSRENPSLGKGTASTDR
jgi:hypothetical protein